MSLRATNWSRTLAAVRLRQPLREVARIFAHPSAPRVAEQDRSRAVSAMSATGACAPRLDTCCPEGAASVPDAAAGHTDPETGTPLGASGLPRSEPEVDAQ